MRSLLEMQTRKAEIKKEIKSLCTEVGMKRLMITLMLLTCAPVYAMNAERLCNAIYSAEGGEHTKYPFGIKSVKCDGYQDCKDVCLRTVNHKYRDWLKTNQRQDFFVYLRDRYAPLSDSKLNNNWLRNVKYFYNRGGENGNVRL